VPRPGSLNIDRRPEEDEDTRRKAANAVGKPISRAKGATHRREGRLTIQAVAGDDEGAVERMRSLASVRRAREREREKRKGGAQEQARASREVVIPDVITVSELSNRMATRGVDVIKFNQSNTQTGSRQISLTGKVCETLVCKNKVGAVGGVGMWCIGRLISW
jgi:translation initiation factor IF-2